MPVPEMSSVSRGTKEACNTNIGHVNLMMDTYIANAGIEDLRCVIRALLATGPAGISSAFASAARHRLRHTTVPKVLPETCEFFEKHPDNTFSILPPVEECLTRARSLYGAGLGFSSLCVLSRIVSATVGLRWEAEGDIADLLALIDSDIGQAVQSSKEEWEQGRFTDVASARKVRDELRAAVSASSKDVLSWGGEFPFERAEISIDYWSIQ